MTRRKFAVAGATAVGAALLGRLGIKASAAPTTRESFEVTKSDEEWRKILTPEQYHVLRQHGTERAFSSPLDKVYEAGTYHCAACDLPVYSSEAKFNSRTGWPSFWKPLDNAIRTSEDKSLFFTRTEVHCRRCGSHLGHVFDDGPPPTGLRYCMNGVALKFVPAKSQSQS